MTPEERKMLEETHQIVLENTAILKSIQQTNRLNAFLKILYWVFIIAATFGAFYVIQPYIDSLKSSLDTFGGTDMSSLLQK